MAKLTKDELITAIKDMSVLELSEIVKALERRFKEDVKRDFEPSQSEVIPDHLPFRSNTKSYTRTTSR